MRKRRDAAETRLAILNSAKKLFASHGYDGIGVREIAARAGVTAMLVNRYFGSKENLFAEASAATLEEPVILTKENIASPDFAKLMVQRLIEITRKDQAALDGFSILLRSAANKNAAKIGREVIEAHHQKTMRAALKGSHRAERAAVLLSIVAGFQMMRQMIEITDLAEASEKDLLKVLLPVIELLISGEKKA